MKNTVIGPFFTTLPAPHSDCCTGLIPLGIQIECASPLHAIRIPLFRHRREYAPDQLRFEDVVFPCEQLPFDLACPAIQVVEVAGGTYLPLDALLGALYAKWQITRSVFSVLAEFASSVPLVVKMSRRPSDTRWRLPVKAEDHGFRVQDVIQDGESIYVEIGWRPPDCEYMFHTCICQYRLRTDGTIQSICRRPAGIIGVGQLLERELNSLVPGGSENLFGHMNRICPNEAGLQPIEKS